jgi:hypothetical protein
MITIETLNFTYNWNNKLDCKAFTTIRRTDRFEVGQHLNVYLNDMLRCHVRIVEKHSFTIDVLPKILCWLDTGYSKAETIDILTKMYSSVDISKSTFYVYTLLKVDISDMEYRKNWKLS